MSGLAVSHPEARGASGPGERVDWKRSEGESAETGRRLHCLNQTPADDGPPQTTWSEALTSLHPWTSWYNVAPVGVLWSLCQMEALQHLAFFVTEACWRLALASLLWLVVRGCVRALKSRPRPGPNRFQGESPEQEVVAERRNNQSSWVPHSGGLGPSAPLARALADSLLLCVLQEPLPDGSAPHVESLLCRLESVFHALEKAGCASEARLEEAERDAALTDKVQLVCTYLQQRTRSLRTLIQAQRDFEASVKDVLEGVGGLWAQLEELHAGVTLTKEGGRGRGDLALARTNAETLFAALGHYRDKLHSCQAHLKDCTQHLQELIWSHTHISSSVNSSGESVWPEVLLQSNIEQFDRVQESFLSLEQQTCTFQAHLEGLGRGSPESLARTDEAPPSSVPPQTPRDSPRASTSSADADSDTDARLSLCERSALQVSSTIGRLRTSGKKKKK